MVEQTADLSAKEKRRHRRLTTRQIARIKMGSEIAIRCEIRDYCQTGLYLAFLETEILSTVIPPMVGTIVAVEFTSGEGETSRSFELNGWVAHISTAGMGLHVETVPVAVLQALSTASASLSETISSPPSRERSTQEIQALREECAALLRSFSDSVLEDFFFLMEHELEEARQAVTNFMDQSHYDLGVQELRQRRTEIEESLFEAMREGIQAKGQEAPVPEPTPSEPELALIEEDEFQDWLNLSAIINRVESSIGPQLSDFEQRYGQLIAFYLDANSDPFGPKAVCRAFQQASKGLDLTNPVREAVYKTFGHALTRHLPPLYLKLSEILARLHPIERPESVPEHKEPEGNCEAAKETSAEPVVEGGGEEPALSQIADRLLDRYQRKQDEVLSSQDNAEYSLDRILTTLNREHGAWDSRPSLGTGGYRLGNLGVDARGGSIQPMRSDASLMTMAGWIQETYSQLSQDPSLQAGEQSLAQDRELHTLPEAALREVVSAMDALPASQPMDQPVFGPSPLKVQLNAQLAKTARGAVRIAPRHGQALDTMASVLGQARAEYAPTSEIESLLNKLERPLLKLALADEGFLNAYDHPARQVVNLLDQCAIAGDDRGKLFDPKLRRLLYLLVDRICAQADRDPTVYATVRDTLEKILQPIRHARRTRVARLQEACEGKERIRLARKSISERLEARLGDREVPEILLRLLDMGWRHYLVLLELRHGPRGDEWDQAWAVLDQLLSWSSPGEPRQTEGGQDTQALLNMVDRKLATVLFDHRQVGGLMDELSAFLLGGSEGPTSGVEAVFVPAGKLMRSKDEDAATKYKVSRLLDRLHVGDWWSISVDGAEVPMQLIWTSQAQATCAFANRSATNKLELSLAELSQKIDRGIVRTGKDQDLPLFERSEYAVVDHIYRRLAHQATHDPITGLINRKGFLQQLTQAASARHWEGQSRSLCVLEFDQFRVIYANCGVEAGDALARNLTTEIRAQLSSDDVLASFKDGTFALYLSRCSHTEGCRLADSLLQRLSGYRYQHGSDSYNIGVNIGLTEYFPSIDSAAEALRRADSACLTAKSSGRNRIQYYEQSNPQLKVQESLMEWAGRIDTILEHDGLYLRAQMVMPIGGDTSLLPYYEILLGIRDEHGEQVNPAQFIPAVERWKRTQDVDVWVMENVFDWIRTHRTHFDSMGGFSINLSTLSLSSPEVLSFLHGALSQPDLPAERVCFEITETAAIDNYGAAQDFIQQIRRYGCKFSIDDFGSGYASYAYLKNLRTDALKIDGAFVKDIAESPNDYAMVKSMNEIGHSLGMRTVAEYVESPDILSKLRDIGVDYAQGFAIQKPAPIDQLLQDSA